MKTEIQYGFWGYVTRFKLPSAKCFKLPLKSALLVFIVQLVTAGLLAIITPSPVSVIIMLLECLFLIGYYIKVLYKDFWNLVLEESKGLFADLLMWVYYCGVCMLTLSPSIAFFVFFDCALSL